MGNVRIIKIRFTEDEIVEGDLPKERYDNPAWDELIEDLTVEEAVNVIQSEGLTFAATGNEWAALPDGSVVVNYYSGIREEASAHLSGWTDQAVAEIIEAVG